MPLYQYPQRSIILSSKKYNHLTKTNQHLKPNQSRYNYQQHHQYFQQHSNDYQQQQRQFMHPPSISSSLNSTTIAEQAYHLNGGPSTGNLSQYHLQHQQQVAGGYPAVSSARSYYSQNDYLDIRCLSWSTNYYYSLVCIASF